MIGILMAGGKGTRMNLEGEKLLLKYKKPIILHVLDSLKTSNCFSRIIAVTSDNSPKTQKLLKEQNIEIFETPGKNFVEDLNLVLQTLDDDVLVTSGDLPLLDKQIIQEIVQKYDSNKTWTSILISKQFVNSFGIKSDFDITIENRIFYFTGISLINSKNISAIEKIEEDYIVYNNKKLAFNLNTKKDYELLSAS